MVAGWKDYQVNDTHFSVPNRYTLESKIGNGQFGTVCKATVSSPSGDEKWSVAIKKIPLPAKAQPGEQIVDEQLYELRRVVREVTLLKSFNHENIISLLDLFSARTVTTEANTHDLYMVTQLLDTDLHDVLRLHRALDKAHFKYFGTQLLSGMAYIHRCGIVHRDVKPSNIVVNSDCDLKVVDFGLARDLNFADMTEYVVTRYYRAPELLCGATRYTPAIDVWSVGCVLVEMAVGCVLFPGAHHRDQLKKILDLCPTPSLDRLDYISSDRVKDFISSLPENPNKINLETFIRQKRQQLGKDDMGSLHDLVSKMLRFIPDERISAEEALNHPFWDEDEEGVEEEREEVPQDQGHEEPQEASEEPELEHLDLKIQDKDFHQLHLMLDDLLGSFACERELDRVYVQNHPEEDKDQ